MKNKLIALGAIALSAAFVSRRAWSGNLWELRDTNNAFVVAIDSSTANLSGTNLDASAANRGTLPNARLDSSSVTLQGNTFNAASKLVQLDGSTRLPAVDGSQLTGVTVGDATINTAKLATDAVTTVKIINDAITAAKIAADAVGSSEIATDAVGSAEIATDAVGSAEIAADAVGVSELATASVETAKLATDSVSSAKILNDAVTAAKIATDAVGSSEIAADAVGSSEIATDAVGSAEIATDAVGPSELAATAVTAASYGTASAVGSFTVDADGRLTAASNTTISVTAAAVSGATFGSGSFTFLSTTTVNTLQIYGSMTAANIRTASCSTAGKCMVLNSDDFDLYTATGTSAGQWRNSRTGVGP